MQPEKRFSLRKALRSAGSGSGGALADDDMKRRKMFVFFMTDGCDTCNGEAEVMK